MVLSLQTHFTKWQLVSTVVSRWNDSDSKIVKYSGWVIDIVKQETKIWHSQSFELCGRWNSITIQLTSVSLFTQRYHSRRRLNWDECFVCCLCRRCRPVSGEWSVSLGHLEVTDRVCPAWELRSLYTSTEVSDKWVVTVVSQWSIGHSNDIGYRKQPCYDLTFAGPHP